MIWHLFYHDLLNLWRSGHKLLHPALAGLSFGMLLTLLISPQAGVDFWIPTMGVSSLFSTILTIPLLWEEDENDGTLLLYRNLSVTHASLFIAKCLLHFVMALLPLGVALVFISQATMLSAVLMIALMLSISLLATLLGLLTLGLKRGGGLLALLALPLMLPLCSLMVQILLLPADHPLLPSLVWLGMGGLAMVLPLGVLFGQWLLKEATHE
jgi:heme exporter protein B